MADSKGYGRMCDMKVGSGECRIVHRKHCLDSSDGVGSEGEVDEWLRNVAGQWSCRGGWVMRLERHGIRSRRWVVDGAVCLQGGCRGAVAVISSHRLRNVF